MPISDIYACGFPNWDLPADEQTDVPIWPLSGFDP